MSSLANNINIRSISNSRLLAEQLLQLAVHEFEALTVQAELIINHFHELQTYAEQIGEQLLPLYGFKRYLDTTSIPFQDDEGSLCDLLLKQAIPILVFQGETFSIPNREMSRGVSYSLKRNFLYHYHDGAQPGNLLYTRLKDLVGQERLFSS